MVLSLGVVSAVYFARRSRTPFQRADSLTFLLKNRIAAYGLIGIVSAENSNTQ